MLTRELVARTYRETHGEDITEANLDAFMRFASNLGCLDCESYQEAHEKIAASMEIISDEIEYMDNDEAQATLRNRYAGLLAATERSAS